MSFAFEQDESVEEGVRRIARHEIDKILADLTGPRKVGRDKAIHASRKGLKRLRALVRLVRDGVGDKAYRRENVAFRDLGRAMSASRDAAVLVKAFDALLKQFEGHVDAGSFRRVRNRLVARRRELTLDAEKQASLTGIARELRAAKGRFAKLEVDGHGWSALEGGLQRIYRQGRNAFHEAEDDPEFVKLHEWRKRVKDLWHHAQLLEPAWPEELKKLGDDAHALADLLGDDHDLGVLRQTLTELPDEFGERQDLEPLPGLIDARRADLQRDAIALGRRLYAEKPRAFARRLKGYWTSWRDPKPAESGA